MWPNVSNLFGTGVTQPSPAATVGQSQQLNSHRGAAGQTTYYEKIIQQTKIEIQSGAFNQTKEDALISLYLEYANFLNKCGQSAKINDQYNAALQKAEAKQQRYPGDPQEKKALLSLYKDWLRVLETGGLSEEALSLSQKIHALHPSTLSSHTSVTPAVSESNTSTSTQASHSTSNVSPLLPVSPDIQTKGKLTDRLFEKLLSILGALKITDTPSLFLVYAHDNSAQGKAEAHISRYLIDKLKQIRAINLYSDQTPLGQPYSGVRKTSKQDGQLTDILTSQLCLLPDQLRDDVEVVDKVAVCCSEVLGNYLEKWPHYKDFCRELQEAYEQDLKQKSTAAIRAVVNAFSQKKNFHHVLTEMAFLQIRAQKRDDQHDIIPVPLTPNSYEQCLTHFIPETTVRMGDIYRAERQAKAGQEIYPNQGKHGVLFKLIERLFVGNEEAQTFLDKFWHGYGHLITRSQQTSAIDALEFDNLVEGIFNEVRTTFHSQLAFTVQQSQAEQRKALQDVPQPLAVLGENIEQFKLAYEENLKGTGELDVLSMYVPMQGIKESPQGKERVDLEAELEQFFTSEARVFLLQGVAGTGKSTFNRYLALKKLNEYHQLSQTQNDPPLVFFIELRSIDNPNKNVIQQFLQSKEFASEQIEALRKHSHQRCIFIFDGYDEIKERNRNFYELNELWRWDNAKFVITSRPEYLDQNNYQTYFRPKASPQALWEVSMAPFSPEQRSHYIKNYVENALTSWTAEKYEQAFNQLSSLKEELERPIVLRLLLQILPELMAAGQNPKNLTLGAVYEKYFQEWWGNWQSRLGAIQLAFTEEAAKDELCEETGGFIQQGFEYIQDCALALTKERKYVAEQNKRFQAQYKEIYRTFFEGGAKTRLLRFNAPLQRNSENHYRFSHTSMQEYLVARAICDPDFKYIAPYPTDVINQLSIVEEPVILDFLVEQVKAQRSFKAYLDAWIEASKEADAPVTVGAANAITILVRARIQFNGANLKSIRIPGADLSYSVFDSAQLQRADLSKTNLTGTWLRHANLTSARMAGVQLGELPSLRLHSTVRACCYSSDGRYLAAATDNWEIELYDAKTLAHLHTFKGHTDDITSIALSPDGQTLASGSDDKTVRLWSVAEKKPLHIFEGHTGWVKNVALSTDGQTLASGSEDKTIRLWSVTEQKLLHTFKGHTDRVTSVALSTDGQTLASGSWDKTVRLWSVAEKKLLHTFQGHTKSVTSIALSRDGQTLASGSGDNTVRLWSVAEKKPLYTFEGHTSIVRSVALSRNGQTLASGSDDNTVRLWSVAEKKPLHTFEGHTHWVTSVALSPDGQTLISGSWDNTVRLWSVAKQKPMRTFEGHTDYVTSVALSPDKQTLASGSVDNTVRLWSVAKQKPRHTFAGHNWGVTSIALSSDGQTLASGSEDNTVRLWSVTEKKLLHSFEEHTSIVRSVALSTDGQTLASGSDDKTVRLWSVAEKKPLHTFEGHTDLVTSVALSSDGQTLASGSGDKTVRLWSIIEQKPLHTFKGHTSYVSSVTFSRDGQTLASGSGDETVRLWSVAEQKPLHTFEGHTDLVTSVALSPDGQTLASGSEDKTVRLWSITSGQCLTVIQGFNGKVNSVAWYTGADGLWLATGSADKVVRLWQVHRDGEACRVTLHWASAQTTLTAPDICIQDVIGLSTLNTQLLKQRGAIGEPRQTEQQEARSPVTGVIA